MAYQPSGVSAAYGVVWPKTASGERQREVLREPARPQTVTETDRAETSTQRHLREQREIEEQRERGRG